MFGFVVAPHQRHLLTLKSLNLQCSKLMAAARALQALGDASELQLRLAPGVQPGQRRNFIKTPYEP